MSAIQHAAGLLDGVRRRRPRVHCLMNGVVPKFVADGLSALGAIPSMTSSPEEVGHFVAKADALLVNLGTLDAQCREAIGIAVDVAAKQGRPWTLDPSHCDYSPPRAAFAQDLLTRGPAVLRANAAEFDLLSVPAGVVAVRTGRQDRIAYNGSAFSVVNGHPLTALVTGTGCLSGAVIAAFLAIEPDPYLAACAAMLAFGVAAEMAGTAAAGPGSFEPALLDALANLEGAHILSFAKADHEQG
ncbi:hydroxyethylthiazole kinase [Aquamicrobium lusatiense]|uniref:hydroxyethylthiazole kinase n=1 Tax=Aquamicrobium lusatiense TaxID=89772 RepID=A0A7W9S150_9HYPH|nr:hydroxyethylthiazole kinase [Aquamicrobium lusatiense]MBB6011994.1 hydroxyethylthiazole kinase [Aquamicrobium lusatiense]